MNQDITLTEKHFYSVFHYSAIGMALAGTDGRWINVNNALCNFLGYSAHELTDITFQEITYPEDLYQDLEYLNQLITGEILSYQREKRYIHKKGHLVWGLLTVSSVMDEENSPVRFITQIQDISESKCMEEELKKKEELYQLISQNAQDVIFFCTPDGVLEFVTPSARTILGYRSEDILGLPLSEFYHPDELIYLNARKYSDSDSFALRFRHKDGHFVWLETNIRLIRNDHGELEKVMGISRDITLRRQMETDLLKSEENLKQAQKIAHLGSWEWNIIDDSVAWSDELFRILEVQPDEFTGCMQDFYNLIHPNDLDKLQQAIADSILGKECDFDCRIITPKGTLKHLHLQGIIIFDHSGRPIKKLGTTLDITERVNTQLLLEETIERHTSLKRYNPDPILSINNEGFFISANQAALKLLSFTEAELNHLHFTDIVTDDCVEYARARFLKVIKQKVLNEACYTIRTKWGELIDVLITPAPIIIQDQVVGCYIIARDITEQKKKDQLLIYSEKQTIAGQLAAAIAHEIRNPLTAIKGFFKLMKTAGYNENYMNVVDDEFNRIEMITSELLVLAKPQNVKMEDKNIILIMEQVIALLETQANMNNVIIKRDICDHSLTLKCDENQIKQVLINILKNSIEVMPKGGEVEVKIRKKSGKLLIGITDQGPGIAEDLIEKLGQPFYSTKEKGTGLGLMVSFKIIELHGGKINISSELDKGTTFEVELPAL